MRIRGFNVTEELQMSTEVQRRMVAAGPRNVADARGLACCNSRRLRMRSGTITAGLIAVIAIAAGDAQQARSQALTAIHTFTGSDGSIPTAGVIRDAEGNIYGTTTLG